MSYEVTATRRRPQKFDDLVGQEFVAETLKNSIKSGKIAHAYLFSGPRGCGKTSTARILAKALNCQHGPTDTPCGQCSACQEITKGSSLDVIEIDGASNTSVENIRQIKDEVLFPPSNSRYKIYIIDEVHMLSTSAFNALLKTIEEPPAYVIFIFATTELQKVPATIKSRCQQFNFRLVAIEKVKQCLAEAAAELNIQADDDALYWIARESTGSMRDSYTLFDQVVAFSDGHITYDKIRDKLGLVGVERLNSIFEACAEGKTDTVINYLDEFLQAGVSIEQLISNSADYLRSLLFIKNGVTKESLLGNSPERFSQKVLGCWNPIQLERALSLFLQLYRDIRYSLSPRYELELAFTRMCWISQFVSNAEVKKAIDAAQALLMNGTSGAITQQQNHNIQSAVQPQIQMQSQVQPAFVPSAPSSVTEKKPESENYYQESVPSQEFNSSAPESYSTASAYDFDNSVMEKASEAFGNPETGNSESELPPGLPRLRFGNDESDNRADNEAAQGDNSNPFSNGGSLPPEQTVSAASLYTNETFTENPDSEDDSYDAADSSEPYVESEEEAIIRVTQTYEESQEAASDSNVNGIQNKETFTTAGGQTMTIAQLRGSVMADLSVTNSFLSALLEKTGNWSVEPDRVSTTCKEEWDLSLMQKNSAVIEQKISSVCGKPMKFSVKIQNEEEVKEIHLPPQVQILLNTFNGTLVGREGIN